MLHTIEHAFIHTIEDSVKLIPFLLITYLIMEAVERAAAGRTAQIISKAGPSGPFLGALLGAFPQCGFSAAASNFYSAGLIGMGTLIAVFMSTSDEMLPVFIAEQVGAGTIAKILIAKIIIGTVSGYVIVFLGRRFFEKKKKELEDHRKEHGHDCSDEGRTLIAEAIIRSLKTFGFIFIITLVLNLIIEAIGEDALASVLKDAPVIGEILAGLVGLIPNCAASIIISQLYFNIHRENLLIGVSLPFSNLDALFPAGQQALFALGTLRGSSSGIQYCRDLAVSYMTGVLRKDFLASSMLHPAIRILRNLDIKKHSGLLETLKVYTDNHFNQTEAAAALHIHLNTLKYRLHKIQDATGIDFTDPEETFYLEISLRLKSINNNL